MQGPPHTKMGKVEANPVATTHRRNDLVEKMPGLPLAQTLPPLPASLRRHPLAGRTSALFAPMHTTGRAVSQGTCDYTVPHLLQERQMRL